MADKKISDFTAVTSLGTSDLFELETGAGNSRKITFANLKAAVSNSGTSFPGSPASGDRYFRTDLGFDCYYDGTRWLTAQQFTVHMTLPLATTYTATTVNVQRTIIPHGDTYDVYLEKVATSYIIVGTGNWTVRFTFNQLTGGASGGPYTHDITVSTGGGGHYYATTTVNAAYQDLVDVDVSFTENSGTATFYPMPSIIYRLVIT